MKTQSSVHLDGMGRGLKRLGYLNHKGCEVHLLCFSPPVCDNLQQWIINHSYIT